jgi:hypothetical protein
MVALFVSLSTAPATFGISAEWTSDGFSFIPLSTLFFAQTAASPNQQHRPSLLPGNAAAATKLTANQQHGMRLLETALAEAKSRHRTLLANLQSKSKPKPRRTGLELHLARNSAYREILMLRTTCPSW